jgi:hypothetical protein
MPAVPPYIIEPIGEQFSGLLPERNIDRPLGCHRSRVSDRVVFEQLVQALVFGYAYCRIADGLCSASTMCRRRDEWIEAGTMYVLEGLAREARDQTIGLQLGEVAVDCCITKAPCGGEKAGKRTVDRGKGGLKRSVGIDANGLPLGTVNAPANRHDSPLLGDTLDALKGGVRFAARAGEDASGPRLRLQHHTPKATRAACSTRSPGKVNQPRFGPRGGGWWSAYDLLTVRVAGFPLQRKGSALHRLGSSGSGFVFRKGSTRVP